MDPSTLADNYIILYVGKKTFSKQSLKSAVM